jgi:signal transduction histidine kinase
MSPGSESGERAFPGGEPPERPSGPGEAGADRGDWPRRIVLRVILQARLDDGAIATFRQSLPGPPGEQPLRLLGWLAAVMVIVAALAGWIVRRLTRPLARFAAAATGLARDLDQPPLPERGAREIAAAAQAFNRMQRDLKQLLETRAQALAAVSHDLRLPLTRVRLRIERIADASTRGAIENDLADMDRMIGNTLEFLRAGKSRESPVPLDLDALVDSVASDIEALGAVVNVQGSSGAPIAARPQALARCLANLLDNARRYGAPAAPAAGSAVATGAVDAGAVEAGTTIDVTLADLGRQVEIRIEDRGPGIAPADRQRVFEPYVRLEDSRAQHTGGTGLGLAIARAIARAHGGDVTLAGRDGGGLAAIVALPRALDGGVGSGRQPHGAVAAH